MAWRALLGVGDPDLGEWTEQGRRGIIHIRRRLSDAEMKESGLTMRDIRGTPEAQSRLQAVTQAWSPFGRHHGPITIHKP